VNGRNRPDRLEGGSGYVNGGSNADDRVTRSHLLHSQPATPRQVRALVRSPHESNTLAVAAGGEELDAEPDVEIAQRGRGRYKACLPV